ncbi:hypothetical protein RJ46_18780 [Vibrio sinaloensis]|nr:hypothetical protein RJ46_18780 [Vibrio sinaloensis]
MYVLVCSQPIVDNACESGWKTLALAQLMPQYMTVEQLMILAPPTLVFFAVCYCFKKLNQRNSL